MRPENEKFFLPRLQINFCQIFDQKEPKGVDVLTVWVPLG